MRVSTFNKHSMIQWTIYGLLHVVVVTVGIVQCQTDFYVDFIRRVFQKCLRCCHVKHCELIYNVLYDEEKVISPDTL